MAELTNEQLDRLVFMFVRYPDKRFCLVHPFSDVDQSLLALGLLEKFGEGSTNNMSWCNMQLSEAGLGRCLQICKYEPVRLARARSQAGSVYGTVSCVLQLPVEELPEFLTNRDSIIRYYAQKRMRELQRKE